jgi:CheY-like chemotaxis protein
LSPSSPTSKELILCIDDDVVMLHYQKMLLERSGYAVVTASSAQEGLKLVTTCNCDVVLLDYEMPGMNGQQVASEIMRVKPGLTVIMLLGGEVPAHAFVFIDAFVLKPEMSRRLLPMSMELCGRD